MNWPAAPAEDGAAAHRWRLSVRQMSPSGGHLVSVGRWRNGFVQGGGQVHWSAQSRASAPLVVTTTFRDASVEVVVVGDIDLASGRQLRSIILGIAQLKDVIRIDVDGRGIRFIDSAGLTVLEHCKAECSGHGVRCFLGPLSPALRQLLNWTGVRGRSTTRRRTEIEIGQIELSRC